MFGSLFSTGLVEHAWRRKVEAAGYRVVDGMWMLTEPTADRPATYLVTEVAAPVRRERIDYTDPEENTDGYETD